LDVGLQRYPFAVYNNSFDNAERAVIERVLLEKRGGDWQPPIPGDGKEFFRRLKEFRVRLIKRVGHCQPWSSEQFIASFDGRKRKLYTNAEASLLLNPLVPEDSHIRGFVKCEKLPLSLDKQDPAPRLIQPRSPRFNVCVGKYIKPLEKIIYSSMSRVIGGTAVLKGYNAVDRGRILYRKWSKFKNPICFGLDASRFDQHVRRYALEWCHSIYNSAYTSPELKRLLKQTLRNKVTITTVDGVLKFTTDGGRASGDMDTSLGNCLITIAMLWTYLQTRSQKFDICCDGDDALAFVENTDLHIFEDAPSWYETMGFVMKIEAPVSVFEEIEFCKCKPVWNGKGYVMTRKYDSISRDLVTILPLYEFGIRNYLYTIGSCGLAVNAGIPVYQSFYLMLLRGGGEFIKHLVIQDMGLWWFSLGLNQSERSITEQSRFSFYLATGITPDEQICLETRMSNTTLEHFDVSNYSDFLDPSGKSLVELY
jgi:hypothetical protein